MSECKHCQNGYFPGSETECVNGVLIDIDEAHEGWRRDVCYPLAPCHSEFGKPEEDQVNDSQERLAAWAALGAESEEEDPLLTRAEAATLAKLRDGTLVAVPVEPTEAMAKAGAVAQDRAAFKSQTPLHVWRAMLAAAQDARDE